MQVRKLSQDGSYIEFVELQKSVAVKPKIEKGDNAPEFIINDINGKVRELRSYKDKYLLLDFWGSWCLPCIKELPEIKKIYQNSGDRIAILGIACNDEEQLLRRFLQKNNIDWPQAIQNSGDVFPESYSVFSFPTLFLIDPAGKIVAKGEELRGENLISTIQRYLK